MRKKRGNKGKAEKNGRTIRGNRGRKQRKTEGKQRKAGETEEQTGKNRGRTRERKLRTRNQAKLLKKYTLVLFKKSAGRKLSVSFRKH